MWFLLWLVLVLGACGFFFWLGRRLFRQAKALTAELTIASDRLAEVSDALSQLADQVPPPARSGGSGD
jgi:hypothetical protein